MSTPAHRWAGWSAITGVVLFAAVNALWGFDQPASDALAPELVRFYGDLSDEIVISGLGSLTACGILVVFAGAVRAVIAELEGDSVLSDIVFGGILLGLATGMGAEATNMAAALRAQDGQLTESLALALFDISYVLGSSVTGIGFGFATLAIGVVALRNGVLLPRWAAVVALAVGVVLATPLSEPLLAQFTIGPPYLLILFVGVRLLRVR